MHIQARYAEGMVVVPVERRAALIGIRMRLRAANGRRVSASRRGRRALVATWRHPRFGIAIGSRKHSDPAVQVGDEAHLRLAVVGAVHVQVDDALPWERAP